MAAPEFVPEEPAQVVRGYESPPWRELRWSPGRPGDVVRQPRGAMFGNQGPDQGYVLVLARRFAGTLTLTEGEHEDDALVGSAAVALKRSSLFGRAPVVHDLTVALTVWGFLGPAPAELVEERKPRFAEAANPHHWVQLHRVTDAVPEATLRMTPDQVKQAAARDWRSLLAL